MFDVPLAQRASQRFQVDVPEWLLGGEGRSEMADGGWRMADGQVQHPPSNIQNPWQLGLIVGPSASGKSTIARAMFGDRVYRPREWPPDRAVIDGLGQQPIKEITRLFTAVGFSSPPSWIKPYSVLSNGEQFRCDLARALMNDDSGMMNDELASRPEATQTASSIHHSSFINHHSPAVVFDEFTSVVDRNVARAVSAAIAKGIRSGRIGRRFVAVTCHYDVTEWLEPDWVIDMATATFARRRLRRPAIELEIVRCRRRAWRMFAPSLFERGAGPIRAVFPGLVGRPAGGVLRDGVADRAEEPLENQPHRHLARLSGHGGGHGGGRGRGGDSRPTGPPGERDRQPPRALGPLPPLAAVANRERPKDRLARHAAVRPQLPRLARPSGGVVRVRGEQRREMTDESRELEAVCCIARRLRFHTRNRNSG